MSGRERAFYASRSTIDLPGRQLELLQAVTATGKPIVLVLLSGRPLDITWAAQNVPSILEVWYPGSEGGNAIADLLFGDSVPGGKLPFGTSMVILRDKSSCRHRFVTVVSPRAVEGQ